MTHARLICQVVLLLAASTRAHAQSDVPVAEETQGNDTIVAIRVEGNRRVEQEAIVRALTQKKGQRFKADQTAADLKALWSLKFFDDAQLLVQRLNNGIVYVVRVVEKPAIKSVELVGNDELSKDDLKDTVDVKVGSIVDVAAIKRNVKKIQEKYVEKGYFLAEVGYTIKPNEQNTLVDVTFDINERAKVMVKEINLLGANKVPASELKGVLATREGSWLSPLTSEGTYREELFQRDLEIIKAVYIDKGFVNIRVDKPAVTLSPDKRNIFISIHLDEGERFDMGKIDFSGDLLESKEKLSTLLVSKPNTVFSSSALRRDIQSITDLYYDQGFAYANINTGTVVNAEAKTVDITFEIQKGSPVSIERIEIVGNTKTRDKVIRRQLRVYEGELFNGTGMRRSKEKVTALGFFETVEVTQKPGSDNEHVVVNVEVKEKSTGTFQVGLGFSNVEQFILTAQVAQQNFLGWGQSASINAQLSALRQFVQFSYFDPYFLDTNYLFSLDAYKTQLDYFGFIRDAYGGTVSLGYYLLADEMSVSLGYTLESVRIEQGRDFTSQTPLAGQFRSGVTSALRASWNWDRRNNRIFPSSGTFSSLTAEFAPPAFGGSYNFNRITANQRGYYQLPLGIVAKAQAQFGLLTESYGRPGAPDQGLPISELYYLGGINSVRGYPLRTLSPTTLVPTRTDPSVPVRDFAVGGDKQFYFNFELEFPILTTVGIRGLLFYDSGNVFGRKAPLFVDGNKFLGLFHSVGFGVRWFSPVGPLRFEWGIPLNRRVNDQSPQFEFTIGNSF